MLRYFLEEKVFHDAEQERHNEHLKEYTCLFQAIPHPHPHPVESDRSSAEPHLPGLLREITMNERTSSKNDDQCSMDTAAFLPETPEKNQATRISWRHTALVEATKHKKALASFNHLDGSQFQRVVEVD